MAVFLEANCGADADDEQALLDLGGSEEVVTLSKIKWIIKLVSYALMHLNYYAPFVSFPR